MASTGGEIWLQWFACCYQPAAQAQRTRRRIDRSMISAPTNFQHTGHIGKLFYVIVENMKEKNKNIANNRKLKIDEQHDE